MRNQLRSHFRNFFQIAILLGAAALLIRFFPVAIRIVEGAAVGLRQFWWVILILSLGTWLIWVLRNRNSG